MNEIVKQHSAESLIAKRNRALELIEQAHKIEKELDTINAIFLDVTYGKNAGFPVVEIDEAKKSVDFNFWKYLLEKSSYAALMTNKSKHEYFEKMEKNPPAFTEETVNIFVSNLKSFYLQNIEKLLTEVYSQFIGAHYHGNRHFKKSNLRGIEKSSRVSGGVKWDIFSQRFRHEYWQNHGVNFDDLFRVCLLLDGKTGSYGFEFRFLAEMQLLYGKTIETEYFTVTGFKNGNNLLKWTRLDILEKFNRFGSGTNKLPDSMPKRYKAEHFGGDAITPEWIIGKYSLPANDSEGFYRTPASIGELMAKYLEVKNGNEVLEPQAGDGALANAIIDNMDSGCIFNLDVCEYNELRREQLAKRSLKILPQRDFIKYAMNGTSTYDRIAMNPPFERYNSIAHVTAAYKLLRPGGRLVSIMPIPFLYRGDTVFSWFRENIFNRHAVPIEAPYSCPGVSRHANHDKIVLLEPGVFDGTQIGACIICLEKPALQKTA